MFGDQAPYWHVEGLLSAADLDDLTHGCMDVLETSRVPCYSLIDRLDTPAYAKVKRALEAYLGVDLFYLNDFYIYTDSTFKTAWHMDTELFSFDRAINAWVLLAPDDVLDPLGFISDLNVDPADRYHSVKRDHDEFVFSDYHSRRKLTMTADELEARHLHTPLIHRGDVLFIDPSRFHMTNVSTPKHAVSIKFLLRGDDGFLSKSQVHPLLWPEVKMFNRLVQGKPDWDAVVDGIRAELQTDEGRKVLSSGFYPEQFEMYRERLRSIVSAST
jgi:hypothetical protein